MRSFPNEHRILRRSLRALCALSLLGTSLQAQPLASRIAAAPDGEVRLEIPSRDGVCGNGRDLVGYRNAVFANNWQSIGGRWSESSCVPGPLYVTLTVANGEVTRVHTRVGGAWPRSTARVTDLGVAQPNEASAFVFALVPQLESASGKDRLLLPAVLADGAPVIQPLLSLAQDERRAEHTRRQAVLWLGQLGDASVIPTLVRLARHGGDEDEGPKSRKKDLGNAALAALAMLPGDVGVPALIDLVRDDDAALRREAVFWLGQNGSAAARRALHVVIENENEASSVRKHAIFSLSHGGDSLDAEFAWLRALYGRIDDVDVKESIIQGMGEDEGDGGRWLVARSLDAREPMTLRKSALFWAGQGDATPTQELVRAYRESNERELREHAIFVLSQREDDEDAIDALLAIARSDADTELRGKALFWLAQSDDARVKKLIADLILKND